MGACRAILCSCCVRSCDNLKLCDIDSLIFQLISRNVVNVDDSGFTYCFFYIKKKRDCFFSLVAHIFHRAGKSRTKITGTLFLTTTTRVYRVVKTVMWTFVVFLPEPEHLQMGKMI